MRPTILLAAWLFLPGTITAQTKPTDSQTLEAILGELRQVRQDLRTLVGTAQRARILVSRVQAQETVIARLQQRVDDTKSALAQTRQSERMLAAEMKQDEELLDRTDNAKTRKDIEDAIVRFKASLATQN